MNNLIDDDWWKTATLGAVKAEVEAGADVMKDNWKGQTPVHMAALYGSLEIIQDVINAGADTTARNCSMTPLHYALKDPGKVKALLAAGDEVDARPEDSTPLFHAVTEGTVDCAKRAALRPCKGSLYSLWRWVSWSRQNSSTTRILALSMPAKRGPLCRTRIQ